MIEAMNGDCFCVSLDRQALRQAIEADPAPVLTTAEAADRVAAGDASLTCVN